MSRLIHQTGVVTVKLILKLCGVIFVPLTVTVAVYVPAASPVFGWTVKLLPPDAILLIAVVDRVKLPGFAPDRATVRLPVG